MGTNQCSRLLEKASAAQNVSSQLSPHPSLIVLARDVYPPTMLAHIPFLAKKLDVPLLLLPGEASLELGQTMSVQRVSVMMFLSSAKDTGTSAPNKVEDSIDSFVAFIKNQLPS